MHIVVSDYTPRESFTVGGTPSSGPFTLPAAFVVFDPSTDLKVYDDGVLLTYASVPSTATEWGWTGTLIDGGYQGGDVNLGATITSSTVVIVRDIPIARATDFTYPSESLDIEGLNTQLDMLFAIFQDRESRANRSLRQPDSDVEDLDELPVAASRANMYLGFDTDGQPTMLDAPADTTAVSSYMASALTAANEAALKAYINAEAGTDFAGIATANTFTADQTITSTSTGAFGPAFNIYHNSASPAASDAIGYINFLGEDSAGNQEYYARWIAEIVDPTSGTEDGRIALQTVIAGTLAARAYWGAGLYTAGATGGDQGTNTINASNYYRNGTQLMRAGTVLTKNPTTADSVTTGAHGLGAAPNMIVAYLECIAADNGYSIGDRIFFASGRTAGTTDAGIEWAADATNSIIVIGAAIHTIDKATLNVEILDLTKWKAEIRPYLLG